MDENFFAGSLVWFKWPVPTRRNESRSYNCASRFLKTSGRKFAPVSTWSDTAAGKEKLAGKRLNPTGTDWLNQPEADTRGVCPLILKPGTRGIVKASTTPMLERERRAGWPQPVCKKKKKPRTRHRAQRGRTRAYGG